MGKPEACVENHLKRQCERRGWLCYKFMPCGVNGVPDRIVIGNGHTVFVELKAPGEVPRKNQLAVHRKMRKAGAEVHVIDNREDVDAFLEDLARREPRRET